MSDITRQKTIDYLYYLKTHYPKNLIIPEYIDYAISSLETDEAYQLEYEQPEISKGLFEQIKWERDIAIQQLHELGYEFGQKIEPTTKNDLGVDCISRQAVLDLINADWKYENLEIEINNLPSVIPQEPRKGHYEKHIDHTDCIWYGSDSGCPVTCSQYRDGWNDAMDYIFKNGKGYQPYRHDG